MHRFVCALLAGLALAGCAGQAAFREGQALVEAGHVDEGLARVRQAVAAAPGNDEYRLYYDRQRAITIQHYLARATRAMNAGLPDEAEDAFKHALALDPASIRAQQGLELVAARRRHQAMLAEAHALLDAGKPDAALEKARAILAEDRDFRQAQDLARQIEERQLEAARRPPRLNAALQRPITLEFRNAPVRNVFELISKHSGLNFIFDRDVAADLRTTVFVKDMPIDEAIRLVLSANQLDRKILDDNTILVYPDTPEKRREYQELVIKSFYLSNADVKQTANMIKTLLKTRDVYADEKLNLLIIRDTPEVVRMAERLVANQDLSEPEVMLDVEVLEVSTSLLRDLGIEWPGRASLSVVGAGGTPGTLTLPEARSGDSSLFRINVPDPLLVLNLSRQDGLTNLLANPRIRVKNKEKARIHIGDRVPVITATTTATGFVAESVSYLDVGLKLEVEPTVYLEDEVGIKVGLEVSSISGEVQSSSSGTTAYRIGTRTAATTLRLKDGETEVLAGLINDTDRRVAQKVPGLADLPVLGRLFSSTNDTVDKTEIVLLITPRIIRHLRRPSIRNEEFFSGTAAELGGAPAAGPTRSVPGASPRITPPSAVPQGGTPAQPAPATGAPGPGTPPSGTPGQAPPPQPSTMPQPSPPQQSAPQSGAQVPPLASPPADQPYSPAAPQPGPQPMLPPPAGSGAGTQQ